MNYQFHEDERQELVAGHIVFNTFIPRLPYQYVIILLLLLKACSYWAISVCQHPEEPLSVIAMYRVGDIQYYPLISGLSQLQLGETLLLESAGTHVRSFPFASISIHAVCYRFLGIFGYIVADILVTFIYYGTLASFLKILKIRPFVSELVSLLVVSRFFLYAYFLLDKLGASFWENTTFILKSRNPRPFISELLFLVSFCCILGLFYYRKRLTKLHLWILSGISFLVFAEGVFYGIILLRKIYEWVNNNSMYHWGWRFPNLWGERIPRPFVTEIFFFVVLSCIFLLLHYRKYRMKRQTWIFLGGATAVSLQGDLHTAINELISIALCLVGLWLFFQESRRSLLKNATAFSISFLLFNIPYFLQRLYEHPHIPRRLGLFPVDRMKPLFLPTIELYYIGGAICIFALLLTRILQNHGEYVCKRTVLFLWGFCVITLFSLPISTIVIGKGIHIYQFQDRFLKTATLVLIVYSLYFFQVGVPIFKKVFPKQVRLFVGNLNVKYIAIGLLFFISTVCIISRSYYFSSRTTAMRNDFSEWGSFQNYRADFNDIVGKLSLYKTDRNIKVLGTLDHQVFCWWTAFYHGFTYLPDPFISTVSDNEGEYRLMTFGHLLGLNSEEFQDFINRRYVNVFWLGLAKYQASKAYTFAPLLDYDEEAKARIKNTTILDSWMVAIPKSEQKRLLADYYTLKDLSPTDFPRLDVIVLTNEPDLKEFYPSSEHFQLTYKNETFRIFIKRRL